MGRIEQGRSHRRSEGDVVNAEDSVRCPRCKKDIIRASDVCTGFQTEDRKRIVQAAVYVDIAYCPKDCCIEAWISGILGEPKARKRSRIPANVAASIDTLLAEGVKVRTISRATGVSVRRIYSRRSG